MIQGEERSAPSRRAIRAAARGVTLVEVLIVVAIMSVIATGATLVAYPEYKKARIRMAIVGTTAVREAAKIAIEIDDDHRDACPTVHGLVEKGKLDGRRADDPWGTRYRITCDDGDAHGHSAGNDRRERTADDVHDFTKPSEVEALSRL